MKFPDEWDDDYPQPEDGDEELHDAHIGEWLLFLAIELHREEMRWDDDGGAYFPLASLVEFISSLAPWTPVERSHSDARYDSVSEFLDDMNGNAKCRENQELKNYWAHGDCRNEKYGPGKTSDWLGGARNGDEVQRITREGWPEGLERARRLLDGFELEDIITVDRRRRMTRGDFGDHLDIGSVYAGRHMTAWTRGHRKRILAPSKVDLVMNMVIPAIDSYDNLFWRGAAGLMLADLLEQSGLPTRLVFGHGCSTTDVVRCREGKLALPMSHRITVKDYGHPIDMATSTAVLHPGFARALEIGWGILMSPIPIVGKFISWVGDAIVDDGEYYASHGVRSEQTAREWMKETLAKIEENSNELG